MPIRRHHAVVSAGEAAATDAGRRRTGAERITIPQETIDRINEVVSPGSSLIVSDEPMSPKETGKGTISSC